MEKYFEKDGKYKVISIGSYGLNSQYVDQNIRALSNEITDGRVVNSGELTMVLNDKTANGTIIGRTLLIDQDNEYVINQRTEIISPKETFDSNFAYTVLNGPFREKVKRIVQGGTQIYVNYPAVSNLNLELPKIEEQKKIGSFFKQLDNLITQNEHKLDLLKQLKQAYLQKIFSQELRFAGFSDTWQQRKLGETHTYFTDGNYGESYPSASDMSDKRHGVPFLRGSDFSNGYLDSSNANYIKQEKHNELTSGHIKQDDIILVVRGSLGTLGYATKENEGWNINSQLAILRTNKLEISGFFLIQYLLGNTGQREILSRYTGTALKQLPIKQMKDISVPIPNIAEQEKIGSLFKQFDNLITLNQQKLNLLKKQKQAFLKKMFI
ncbi:restriction endonuclease subunit S [Leuconostoc pseudomesenteroides]|uniref:restriction endonuclease subunit S n=1 Tax=Leuconostoc pseudomesenteroides TaxID=33968 RepID=UPI001E3A1174|nr:restriction endonuclease subunit S [Leuconostoc pseudomesenteroides]